MKILLFGKNGQVGWELNRSLQPLGEIIVLDIENVDFSNPESLRQVVQNIKPNLIVNAVAYTAVDKAEAVEDLALNINGVAPGILAEEALKLNALLVHYSTEYVFDGTKKTQYIETDSPNPLNAYGRTKLAGELAIQSSGCDYLILRTSWVYASRANNFMLTMLKLAQEREELSVVDDQTGAPTTARLLADTTVICIQQSIRERLEGVFISDLYHLTASGQTSWHGFTKEIIKLADSSLDIDLSLKKLNAISTVDYPTAAKRPANSSLSVDKIEKKYRLKMPDWLSCLKLSIYELQR